MINERRQTMSPIFRRQDGYVFKVFSNEEARIHIHVIKAEKEAKFWLEPKIEISVNYGFNNRELKAIEKIINENADDFKTQFIRHIGKRVDD